MLAADPLTATVQRLGCNRLQWADLAAVAAGLDRSEFITDGTVDEAKVAVWVDRVLPARAGPDWETVERLVGADDVSHADLIAGWPTPDACLSTHTPGTVERGPFHALP